MDVTVKRSWMFAPANAGDDAYKAFHDEAPGRLTVGEYGGFVRGRWNATPALDADTFLDLAQSYTWPLLDVRATYLEDGEEQRQWLSFDELDTYDIVRARVPFTEEDDRYLRWQSNRDTRQPPYVILRLGRFDTTAMADVYSDTRPDVDRDAAEQYVTELETALAAPEQYLDDR